MTAQQLKNAILQEAIQGRLVPQDPNDEPASVLLDRIRKEKQQLVKEGKLKKKDLEVKPISEDEIPFEIPENWEWVRLSEVIDVRDGTHDTPAYIPHGYPLITGKDFYNGYFDLSKTQYISESDYIEICKRSKVDIGDILFSMIGGNIGSQILISRENYFEMAIKNVALFKQFPSKSVDSKYLSVFLESRVDHIKSIALGGAQSFVSLKMLRTYLFPLPPLAEQQRIVAKIEELLPKVEAYGKAQDALNKLNEELPERLKKSILQEAIEGRLVPQDPNDEPASVLLNRIREEKQRLVKEGKLKKKDLEEKPISEDEIPFDIPESWERVKLSFVTSLLDGERREGNFLCLDAKFLRGKSTGEILSRGKFIVKNDNIILVDGENSGEVFTAPCNGYMGSTFKQLWISEIMYLPYVLHFIRFYKDILRNSKKGAAIPHLNKDIFYNLVVGIPPLAEQRRIVEKFEQLFKEIDKLKK